MQGRHPELNIVLDDKQRKILEKISRSKKAEVRLVQRVRIILLSSERKYRNTEIGAKVGCNRDTVRKWQKCFHERGFAGLKDASRSGHPLKFTAKERTKILAMSTKSPELEGKHFTDWTVRSLATHIVKKNIVKKISKSTIWRFLTSVDIKPHKWEYWLNSKDPDFEKKNVEVYRAVRKISRDV